MFECRISAIQMHERRFSESGWKRKRQTRLCVGVMRQWKPWHRDPVLYALLPLFPYFLLLFLCEWAHRESGSVLWIWAVFFVPAPSFSLSFDVFLSPGWTVSQRNLATQMWSVCWRGGMCSSQIPLRKHIISLYMAIRHATHYRPSIRH